MKTGRLYKYIRTVADKVVHRVCDHDSPFLDPYSLL